jgi:hypothetical protein
MVTLHPRKNYTLKKCIYSYFGNEKNISEADNRLFETKL